MMPSKESAPPETDAEGGTLEGMAENEIEVGGEEKKRDETEKERVRVALGGV